MKDKYAFWLTPETKAEVARLYTETTAQPKRVRGKGTRFYCGYVRTRDDQCFLPSTLSDILEGTLGIMANRIGKLLFKQLVELGILSHIIAADTHVDQATLERLRGRCVNDVKRTNGQIQFKDILQFQREA